MHHIAPWRDRLALAVDRLLPRILSQVGRDPGSPGYGCFDRTWWHYKIRDFPSIMLQQGGYTLWLAGRLTHWHEQRAQLQDLAAAAAHFWNARACRHGAFEEYYPWEQGYPPLAFTTLAMMKLVDAGVVKPESLRRGARVAARQLTGRFEGQAANQQVAGLAALAWLRKVYPHLVSDRAFEDVRQRTMALQTGEGWFMEYGGPDLGYLSVTLDCLWDLHDATGDAAYIDAGLDALQYMLPLVHALRGSPGMHNARNTDYLVPYGLVRFVTNNTRGKAVALHLLHLLFDHLESPDHFLHAIDDRYLCHYTGHSLVRALLVLEGVPSGPHEMAPPLHDREYLFPLSGHYVLNDPEPDGRGLLLSLRKGGLFSARRGASRIADFGWVVETPAAQYVSHWWSDDWTWTREGDTWEIQGFLVPHNEHVSTPWKHAALRAASLVLGRSLIGRLKDQMIFKKEAGPYSFRRRIEIGIEHVRIEDEIRNLPADARVRPAPRSSKRHVASADSYHIEDLQPTSLVRIERTERLAHGIFTADTRYLNL